MVKALETGLVEAAVGGDIESFGKLCRQYYAPIVAVAYSILSDHQLAEDAAQETFARALVNLRRLKRAEKFAPWLAQICRNVAKDMVEAGARKIDREKFSIGRDSEREKGSDSIESVRRAIDKLPFSAKQLLVLRYYNDLSYEQISAVLGISKTTINGRLTRATRKLAKYLRHDGILEC